MRAAACEVIFRFCRIVDRRLEKRRPPLLAAGFMSPGSRERGSADEADAFLGARLCRSRRLRRQLQHGCRLSFA